MRSLVSRSFRRVFPSRCLHASAVALIRTRTAEHPDHQRVSRAPSPSDGNDREAGSGSDDNDEDAELHKIAADGAKPISMRDQQALLEQLIAVRDPVMKPVDVSSLETTEYSPVAPNFRWLSLPGVRGVELAIPRSWNASRGQGASLSIPFRTYHFSPDAASGLGLTSVALSVTLYKGAFTSPLLRSTPYVGALGVTQLFAQIHQAGRARKEGGGGGA
jgi:hypothetical protein